MKPYNHFFKTLAALLIFMQALSACSSLSVDKTEPQLYHYPQSFLQLESQLISGELTVYDDAGKTVHTSDLTITDDQVFSDTVNLSPGQVYHFVLVFHYQHTASTAEAVAIAYVSLSQTVDQNHVSFAYTEDDIVYDNLGNLQNDLSPEFSLGAFSVPNLDVDGDGVSNLREVIVNTNPSDASSVPDSISVNLVSGQAVQDTVSIIAQYISDDEAQILTLVSPVLNDQNSLSDIYQGNWDTSVLPEDQVQTLTFLARSASGVERELSIDVVVDNHPNVDFSGDELIQSGSVAELKWLVQNHTSFEIDQGIGEMTESQGSKTIQPIETQDYTLTATRLGSDGKAYTSQRIFTVVVNQSPELLDAQSDFINLDLDGGEDVTVSWEATDGNGDDLSYQFLLYQGSGCLGDSIGSFEGSGTSIELPELSPLTDYSYTVIVKDGQGGVSQSTCQLFTTMSPGLVSWWRFEDGSGQEAANATEALLNGELQSFEDDSAAWTHGINEIDGALTFTGKDERVFVSSDEKINDLFLDGGTVELWVYPKSVGESGEGYLLSKCNSLGDLNGWLLSGINASDQKMQLRFEQGFEQFHDRWQSVDQVLNLDQWNHIVLSYEANADVYRQPRLYINGSRVGVEQTDGYKGLGSLAGDDGYDLYIGNRSSSDKTFDGLISEVRLYDQEITYDQVIANCEAYSSDDITCSDRELPQVMFPENGATIAKTQALLVWEPGLVPQDKAVDHYQVCYTQGASDALDDESECANETHTDDSFHLISDLSPALLGDLSYWWKVRSCYDADCTQSSPYSGVQSFKTDDSLLSWLSPNYLSNDIVDKTSNHALSLEGSPSIFPEDDFLFDSQMELDGVDNTYMVNGLNSEDVDVAHSVSFEVWVSFNALDAYYENDFAYLISNIDGDVVDSGYGLYFDNRVDLGFEYQLRFFGVNTKNTNFFSVSSEQNIKITDSHGWYHVVGTYNSIDRQARLYINGDLVDSTVFEDPILSNGIDLHVGSVFDSSLASQNNLYFKGDVGDALVYSRALSHAEVLLGYCSAHAANTEAIPDLCFETIMQAP